LENSLTKHGFWIRAIALFLPRCLIVVVFVFVPAFRGSVVGGGGGGGAKSVVRPVRQSVRLPPIIRPVGELPSAEGDFRPNAAIVPTGDPTTTTQRATTAKIMVEGPDRCVSVAVAALQGLKPFYD